MLVARTPAAAWSPSAAAGLTTAGTCHIARLGVAPDLRGQGLGWRMLRAVEAAHDALRFELFTGADSHDNIRLYERNGYTIFDRRPLDRGPGLVYLAKPLVRTTPCSGRCAPGVRSFTGRGRGQFRVLPHVGETLARPCTRIRATSR